jgi:protein TonB
MLKIFALLLVFVAMPSLVRAQAPATPDQTDKDAGVQPDGKPVHIGGSVTPPVLIHSVMPNFTKEDRRLDVKGSVQIYLWVDENGNPSHVRVIRGVGMGLDEKAIEAVRQYKFKPAMQNGKPVKVDLYINVNIDFH